MHKKVLITLLSLLALTGCGNTGEVTEIENPNKVEPTPEKIIENTVKYDEQEYRDFDPIETDSYIIELQRISRLDDSTYGVHPDNGGRFIEIAFRFENKSDKNITLNFKNNFKVYDKDTEYKDLDLVRPLLKNGSLFTTIGPKAYTVGSIGIEAKDTLVTLRVEVKINNEEYIHKLLISNKVIEDDKNLEAITTPVILDDNHNREEFEPVPYGTVELSDDWRDFDIAIDSVKYTFPYDYKDFSYNKWNINVEDDGINLAHLEEMYNQDIYLSNDRYTDDNLYIKLYPTFKNFSNEPLNILSCNIVGISTDYINMNDIYPTIEISKGIHIGSTKEEITQAYGKPSSTSTDEFEILTYESEHQTMDLYIGENGLIKIQLLYK